MEHNQLNNNNTKTITEMKNLFINVSNHPSTKWSNEQLTAAQKAGEVVDIQFPNVLPTWGNTELRLTAESLIEDILNKAAEGSSNSFQNFETINAIKNLTFKNLTVHIMGEMTLVHMVVNYLSKLGVCCVASTTERVVTENPEGTKTSTFKFVRFREYTIL